MAVLEQLAASYRAQEKVTDRRDQREMDDIGARARLVAEDQDGTEQGGRP